MCRMQCLLTFIVVSINLVNSWDIAITNGDHLEFYTNGTKTSNEGIRFRELTALAYDAVHNMLLFVDNQNDNASIFSYHLATKKYQPLVRKKLHENIQGIAFDPITSMLFWTDTNEKSIFWISLAPGSKNNANGNLLIKMDDELPRAIAVDSCRGYIYWTNTNITNATIERARFNGTDRQTIISKNNHKRIYMPVSIAIDQQSRRLYWADDMEGIHYTIESSDLEGRDIKTELQGQFHQPNMLTVSKDSIYWLEWGYNTILKLPKHHKKDEQPENLIIFKYHVPFGVVANYNIEDQTKNIPECQLLASLAQNRTTINETFNTNITKEGLFCLHGEIVKDKKCECSPGYIGERCEVSVCQNYCFQGDCSLSNDGRPTCRCQEGFSGIRCEVNQCHGYCLNDAECSLDLVNQKPVCKCPDEYEGQRCEVQKPVIDNTVPKIDVNASCNCTNKATLAATSSLASNDAIVVDSCDSWDPIRDPIMMVLGILCGVLCVTCAVLITKILHLKKRPRIKKRIIVNKNVTPLTARPDQCEITIENCCNMNICETPCFEPRSTIRPTLLDAKPGKEEKRNLIGNMEHPDDF